MNQLLLDVGPIGVAESYLTRVVAINDVGAHDSGFGPNDVVVVVGESYLLLERDFAGVFDDVRFDDVDLRFNLGKHRRFAFVPSSQAASLPDGVAYAALQIRQLVEACETPRPAHAYSYRAALGAGHIDVIKRPTAIRQTRRVRFLNANFTIVGTVPNQCIFNLRSIAHIRESDR